MQIWLPNTLIADNNKHFNYNSVKEFCESQADD